MNNMLRTCALFGAVLIVLVIGTPAAAHTYLVATRPKADATVTERLTAVVLRFNEPVNQSVGKVEVRASDGTAVHDGAVEIDAERVRQPLGALPVAGDYTVEYRVVAADGHAITGKFRFTYDGPVPAEEAEPTSEPAATSEAPETEAAEMHSEPAQSESEAVDQAGSGNDDGQAQTAATGSAETPWALLAGTAAVLVAFIVAAVYAVRALARRQRETGP
jgi:methionine-rich copper-binding protein CopC